VKLPNQNKHVDDSILHLWTGVRYSLSPPRKIFKRPFWGIFRFC